MARYICHTYGVRQALISDTTRVTKGGQPGTGCAISLRDSLIPQQSYVERIRRIAEANDVPSQLEVEGVGSSDDKGLQRSDMPWNWCFVGAAEDEVHSPDELVDKRDFAIMLSYKL